MVLVTQHNPEAGVPGPGHVPVLLNEVIDLLEIKPGGRYIDATFGGGGHSRAILEHSAPEGALLALDADPEAITRSEALQADFPNRLTGRREDRQREQEIQDSISSV